MRISFRDAIPGVFASVALLVGTASNAHAYCTRPKTCYSLIDEVTCEIRKEIPIYINADEANIARVGLDIDDINVRTDLGVAVSVTTWEEEVTKLSISATVRHTPMNP